MNMPSHHTLHSYPGPYTMSCAVQPNCLFTLQVFHFMSHNITRVAKKNTLCFQNDTENMQRTQNFKPTRQIFRVLFEIPQVTVIAHYCH